MKRPFAVLSLGLMTLSVSSLLMGCGVGTQLAPSGDLPVQVTISGGLQGSDYGGHAPIVGAQVFLLQASTSGYGTMATSLLNSAVTSSGGGADTTIIGTAGSPAYYVTTTPGGFFNITGDYTCTAGLPVYVYAIGGEPQVNTVPGPSTITSATGNGTTATFTTSTQSFTVGELVEFLGIPAANPFSALNGTMQTITAVPGTTSFSIASTVNATSSSFSSASVGASNPAIVNVAVLGNCPTSAPFTFGTGSSKQINFIYDNEVSTVAAMFALAPFAETTAGTGTDARYIGIPGSDALALTGIQNAAVNAGQLYDITGVTNGVTNGDGEGHNARSVVPGSASAAGQGGYATVPQSLIDTLGNILAACVDSSNTKGTGASGGSYSSSCSTLFATATLDGTSSGTQATDTAAAAINIAHYPAGNKQTATTCPGTTAMIPPFVCTLYNLPTGAVPFAPNLSTVPNDFVIGLNITSGSSGTYFLGSTAKPNGIATDANGNAFVTTTGCNVGCTIEIPPSQVVSAAQISYTAGGTKVALDPTGRVWVVNASQTANGGNGPSGAFYVAGTLPLSANSFTGYGTYNTNFAAGTVNVAIDGAGVAYVSDSAENYIHKITALGTAPAFTQYLIQGTTADNCERDVLSMAVDSKASGYNIWTVNNLETLTEGMCAISNAASTVATTATSPVNTGTVLSQLGAQYTPLGLAIDANGSGWDANSSPLASYNQTGEAFPNCFPCTSFNGAYTFAGGSGTTNNLSNGPSGVAIDGNNQPWFANYGTNSVSVFKNGGKPTSAGSPTNPAISPSTGYTAGGTLSGPTAIAIDPSGDVWVINTGTSGVGYSVTELIGVAAPTYLPLSSASLNNKLGGRP